VTAVDRRATIDALVRGAHRAGLPRPELRPDPLIDRARRATGLDDLGPDDFAEPLEVLCTSLREEADLSDVGRLATAVLLGRLLRNRLALEADRARDPAIAETAITRPVFVLGLPRTGSTLLHELLCLPGSHRGPESWAVLLPSPPPDGGREGRRVARTAAFLGLVELIAPRFRAIHELGPRLPQECIAITAQAFRSIQFTTSHPVPGYERWLASADMAPAYAYHRRVLQHLQARRPGPRWILKAPAHLASLDALLAEYPDASFVQTHRDPAAVIPSIASLSAHLHRAFARSVDAPRIGAATLDHWSRALAQAAAHRAADPALDARFVDVDFDALMARPLDVLAEVHAHLGAPFGAAERAAASDWLARRPRHRHGVHRYAAADFGLDEAAVRARFDAAASARPRAPVRNAPAPRAR
jgi:hypothetical protein